jgi:glycerol-3-phosphate acyltransferase PlsY
MDILSLISLPAAYLLGTIPTACLVARFIGRIDLRDEGDGRISAAAVYRRAGLPAFLITVIVDIGKALAAVLLAQHVFHSEPLITLLAGALCVTGHQWSPFLRFRGGLGATVIGGTLVGVVMMPTLIGAGCAAVLVWSTRKSGRSFAAGIVIIAVVLFAAQYYKMASPPLFPDVTPVWMFTYPLILGIMMVLKALQAKYLPGRLRVVK